MDDKILEVVKATVDASCDAFTALVTAEGNDDVMFRADPPTLDGDECTVRLIASGGGHDRLSIPLSSTSPDHAMAGQQLVAKVKRQLQEWYLDTHR